jgi:acetyl-CoA/propionyl-CoA carboxylase carboxyl transferase subunit
VTAEKSWKQAINALEALENQAATGGGEVRLEKLRDSGRLTARERIDYILDDGSFVELNKLAEHQCHDFGMENKKFPGDGVITGHGLIDGRKVFIYAEDETVLGGSSGRTHGSKIHYILRLARQTMVPVICLNSSPGARIQEGMDNVFGVTRMFYENAVNSGVVPQISAVMGTCSGAAAYSSALCDFVIQVKDTSYLFLTGPSVIKEVTGEEVSFEDLGGARVHSRTSGVVHLTAEDEKDCLDQIKRLLDFLPQNNRQGPARKSSDDPPEREVPELIDIVPINTSKIYDMKDVIGTIVDDRDFLEIHKGFAKNIVVGFGRLDGYVTGFVASNPKFLGGCLDLDAADKAARFIRTCDAFNIPLVSLADVPGFRPGLRQEHAGIIRHGAKMLYAWTEASVPKIAVVLRKMYGGSIPAMGAHQIGFDQVFAWPAAEMQMLGAAPAVKILYRRELEAADDRDALYEQKIQEYQDTYLTPYHASSRSVIDAVIQPKDTRSAIVAALRMLDSKQEPERVSRKHGNIPL